MISRRRLLPGFILTSPIGGSNFVSQIAEQLKLCVSTVAGFVSRVDVSPFGVTRRVSTFMSPTICWWETQTLSLRDTEFETLEGAFSIGM